MSRLALTLPEVLPFATELEVRITDLNYGKHLGNDAMVSLLHEARWRFLRKHGLSESDCGGTSLVVGDLAIVYRAESFAGDVLRFEVGVTDLARVGCDFVYRVTRIGDGKVVAEAKTGIVFLDPATRRPTRVPASVAGLVAP
ncbi:MAG: thioesterase family protein [Planctomycetes bacterium]|nr:thioesterase family protein [Planctomycetota bacterium]